MNADQVVMEYLLESAIAAQDVIVVPPILHGWFPAFRDFPGTEVSDPNVFQAYVYQVALSLAKHGANRLVFLNTGISNATGLPIAIAAREIRVQMGVPTLVVSWNDLETEASQEITEQSEGGHGDEIETSINLYLQPENVHMELAVQDYGNNPRTKMPGYQPGLFSRNTEDPAYSDTGIYGDPTLATAEKGERALNIMRNEWLSALRAFSAMPARARD
jgi:creatinine amidohydrolase